MFGHRLRPTAHRLGRRVGQRGEGGDKGLTGTGYAGHAFWDRSQRDVGIVAGGWLIAPTLAVPSTPLHHRPISAYGPSALDLFAPGAEYDDVVVGAGLTGLVTAVLLARAGRRVAVLEARHVGAVTTGNTTAKLSLLQGTTLSSLIRYHSQNVAAAYVEGNLEGQAWLLRYCEDHQVAVDLPSARAGCDTGDRRALPYASYGAIRLADQAQLDPLDLLAALSVELRSRHGVLVQGVRVTGVALGSRAEPADAGRSGES